MQHLGTLLPLRAFARASPASFAPAAQRAAARRCGCSCWAPTRPAWATTRPSWRGEPGGDRPELRLPGAAGQSSRAARPCSTSPRRSTPSPARCAGRAAHPLHRQEGPLGWPTPAARWRAPRPWPTAGGGHRCPCPHQDRTATACPPTGVGGPHRRRGGGAGGGQRRGVERGGLAALPFGERCAADAMLGRGAVSDPFLARRIRAGARARRIATPQLAAAAADRRVRQRVLAKVEARHAAGAGSAVVGHAAAEPSRAELLRRAARPEDCWAESPISWVVTAYRC